MRLNNYGVKILDAVSLFCTTKAIFIVQKKGKNTTLALKSHKISTCCTYDIGAHSIAGPERQEIGKVGCSVVLGHTAAVF